VVESFRHHRDDRRESALDFVGHSQGEHEVLAGGVHIFRRSQDGAEIVARMSEAARRHVTVEEIDVARQAGVEERRLVYRGLAAADQRATSRGTIFFELLTQRMEGQAGQRGDRTADTVQDIALEQPADVRRQLRRASRVGERRNVIDGSRSLAI
jgi:hypothetical protein